MVHCKLLQSSNTVVQKGIKPVFSVQNTLSDTNETAFSVESHLKNQVEKVCYPIVCVWRQFMFL